MVVSLLKSSCTNVRHKVNYKIIQYQLKDNPMNIVNPI